MKKAAVVEVQKAMALAQARFLNLPKSSLPIPNESQLTKKQSGEEELPEAKDQVIFTISFPIGKI